jgi:hypothetical protein
MTVSRIMGRAKKLARSRLGLKTCISSPCFSLCFFTLLSMIYKELQQPDTNNLTIIPSYTDNGHPTCQQCRHVITTTRPNKVSSSRGLRLMASRAPGMCFLRAANRNRTSTGVRVYFTGSHTVPSEVEEIYLWYRYTPDRVPYTPV